MRLVSDTTGGLLDRPSCLQGSERQLEGSQRQDGVTI